MDYEIQIWSLQFCVLNIIENTLEIKREENVAAMVDKDIKKQRELTRQQL